jgi:hypothetical protein
VRDPDEWGYEVRKALTDLPRRAEELEDTAERMAAALGLGCPADAEGAVAWHEAHADWLPRLNDAKKHLLGGQGPLEQLWHLMPEAAPSLDAASGVSTPAGPDGHLSRAPGDVGAVIARAQKAKAEADERDRQRRAEEKRRNAPLLHLLSAWAYTSPTGRTTDPANWVNNLYLLLGTAAPYVQGDIVAQLPPRGEARQVLAHVCGLIQTEQREKAEQILEDALDSALAPALWEDLSRHLPDDIARLLPEDLQEKFKERRDGKPRVIAAAAVAGPSPAPPPVAPPQPAALELAKTPDDTGMSLRRVKKYWHLCFQGEKGDFPVKGNQFLGWLTKLLSKPDYDWTVAELLGDPGGKLKADALLGGECATDKDALRAIWERIQEINAIVEETDWSEKLEEDKEELLRQVQKYSATERMGAGVTKAYNNITTQKRQFLTKLQEDMPQLTAHLRACLKQTASAYTLSYRPPPGTPRWDLENPPA